MSTAGSSRSCSRSRLLLWNLFRRSGRLGDRARANLLRRVERGLSLRNGHELAEPAAECFAEARLWDLIPGRPRGGAWTVTQDSVLAVVGADVASTLVQYGFPYLDEMTQDIRQLADVMRRYQARGLYSPLVDWRERKARLLWLMGEREAAALALKQ